MLPLLQMRRNHFSQPLILRPATTPLLHLHKRCSNLVFNFRHQQFPSIPSSRRDYCINRIFHFSGQKPQLISCPSFRRSHTLSNNIMSFQYPVAEKEPKKQTHLPNPDVLENYPYLEDPSNERTKQFVREQNKLFQDFIHAPNDDSGSASSEQLHKSMKSQMEDVLNSERIGNFHRRGDYIYFSKNSGLQNQNVFYQMKRKPVQKGQPLPKYDLEKDARVFIDPNTLSEDGTTSIGSMCFSKDGKYLTYGLQEKGSDWQTLYVMNCDTLEKSSDEIPNCKFTSVSWMKDSANGFFYTRYPAGTLESKNEYQKIFWHKMGNKWQDDQCIYTTEGSEEEKDFMFDVTVTHDGQYLLIGVSNGCDPVNRVWLAPADNPTQIKRIIDDFKHGYFYITNDDKKFYFRTNDNAPRYKVIVLEDIEKGLETASDLIPQKETDVLEFANCTNENYLLVGYMHNVHTVLQLHDLKTGDMIREVPTPPLSSVESVSSYRHHEEVYYKVSSFTLPSSIYEYDMQTKESNQVYQTKINFSIDEFEAKQVWYTSKDGTKIPMFIVHKKGLKLDGSNPALLYGYGGFNISLEPSFSALRLFWCSKFNGVYCIANLRGGGEFGEEWHKAGSLKNKQNCFDDCIAAAEYLIENKYTSNGRLIVEGGSNGGLLVGAVVNQRPDLFALGLAHVGVMDMLNFARFTIGYAWKSDYGDPEDKEFFEILYKYSPLHNIRSDAVYPAVLGLTAEQDDRVVPSHTLKWMAELQSIAGKNKKQTKPLMLRVDTSAGHGGGNALKKKIESEVDKYLYALKVVDGLKYHGDV